VKKTEKLTFGSYYHIHNRGINSCNLFKNSENYVYFLNLYDQYISPVADTFAWVLMPNHFHFLVRIKEENEIIPDEGVQKGTLSFCIKKIIKYLFI
jgi:REP element-mobilizing transposase RayT